MQLNRMIDQTFLKPNATRDEIEHFCHEAARYQFICVAMLPNYLPDGVRILRGTGVHVMAGISFPRGQVPLELKRFEIEEALSRGADEIDMVLNLYAIKLKDFSVVESEISMLRELTSSRTGKAILETSLLSDPEIETVCRMASNIGIDFVKSSTGFDGNKATFHAVEVMRRSVAGRTRVKAAGGISNLKKAVDMIRAGVDRIGTSAGPAIMDELMRDGRDLDELLGRSK
jgi:deoxyribose-phosphate aldolase